jgi:hypothetical protein
VYITSGSARYIVQLNSSSADYSIIAWEDSGDRPFVPPLARAKRATSCLGNGVTETVLNLSRTRKILSPLLRHSNFQIPPRLKHQEEMTRLQRSKFLLT